jgi:PadR family transcriptional regulator PadR
MTTLKHEEGFGALRKGLLELAVLSAISQDKAYVADILARLDKSPFSTTEGTLYPLLSRLKRQGLLAYQWAESETGPPRKYYQLTHAGTERLHNLKTYWKELETSIDELGEKR